MSDTTERTAALSAEGKRTLLAHLLRQRASEPKSYPVSYAQERLWFLDQLEPGTHYYNIFQGFELAGSLDRAALEQSLQAVVRRHEALRTTFVAVDGRPVQVIAPRLEVPLPLVDLGDLPTPERREAEAVRRATEEARQPFDLAHGPLIRTTLLRLSETDHVLLLTLHHIVADGWSLGVFFHELAALYTAYAAGQPAPLPELPLQYVDYAVWQREWLQGEVLETQLAYWRRQLAGAPAVLQLPTDHPRPAVQTYRGAHQAFTLPAALVAGLQALSQREGATLFMTLLAAFQVLLSRYSGQEDLVVGTPIAGRTRAELEGLIGFCVNTLALRADLSGNPTFRELLGRVREGALGAYAHQDLPFERLVEEVAPDRDVSHTPVFQAMLALEQGRTAPLELPGLRVRPLGGESGVAKFDLTLSLREEQDRLGGSLEYNADLLEASTSARMVGHLHTLLEGLVADPEQRIGEVPLLTEEERRQILQEWNATRALYPRDVCLHQLFEAQVERTPDAVAVVFGEEQLTYGELNRRANQLAHHLQGLGVGPEVLVGLCVERSLELVVGLLGILKAGGAYVPLDPTYPSERLAFMLGDAQIPVLLTQERLLERLPEYKGQVVWLDVDWDMAEVPSQENLISGITAENLAYVIYTSGSTGQPKGAMLPHRAICNRLLWALATEPLTPADAVLQTTSLGFDVSVLELFRPLLAGARSVLIRPGGQQDSAYLVKLMAEQHVTIVDWVPSLLEVLLEEPGLAACTLLRQVTCGGEPLPVALQQRYHARLGAELRNRYGPTEAAVDVTCFVCQPGSDSPSVPIGRPIANTQIYILDAQRHPVPIGVSGELHIGGAGLAWGYLNRPELTAEWFIPNPFSAEPGARLYRTGDLARYLPDGTIEFLGRTDTQVKIRGYRIELGEIEAVLSQHPGVRACVVATWEEVPGDKRLVAYVVPQPEHSALTSSELRRALQEQLPDYMVPSAFLLLEALPLTANGKVDRRALPAPDRTRPQLDAAYLVPRTELERTISAIWQELLRVEQVGIHDNFFDLGGHSLLMVQAHAKLGNVLQRDISLIDLFKYPTVSSLARYLSPDQGEQTAPVQQAPSRAKTATTGIAIVGVAGRFPGAQDIEAFWRNLQAGVETVSFFSDEEVLAEGIAPHVLKRPNYVKAAAALEDIDLFDAAFFGFTRREAEIANPQQRFLLECAWQALENAGYDPATYSGRIGVYAGAGTNNYLRNLSSNPDLLESVGSMQVMIGNDPDFLATRVSYKLNLKGPSLNVYTGCSTSLVTVHLACQGLLNGECDMALAGGVDIRVPHKAGYLYQEEGIFSPDGHCRPFDARAQGTINGNGVGIVVLKRFEDALADGDCILAVIKGWAINNDGSAKVGYTAPSVEGQSQVISVALAMAGIAPETISYVEAHGTATPLGDPVEIAALTQAFRAGTQAKGFCAIGSLKSNVGHLNAAAGVGGLIKTVLALEHKVLPPSLHFEHPNPKIDFANSPFYVNTRLTEWKKTSGTPRRAGVSSLGIGGTNAHVVLEEAPPVEPSGPSRPWQVLVLSTRTASALETDTANLIEHVKQHPDLNLADVAYTLQVGRKALDHRRMLVCRDCGDLVAALEARNPERVRTAFHEPGERSVVFMFPGGGAQYGSMGAELYQAEPIFHEQVDRCAELLEPHLGLDLRTVLYPREAPADEVARRLGQPALALPALFVTEYALAQLWMAWGVRPKAMIGHSLGEYVAACLAGVFSLEDALAVVVARGQLMQTLPGGAMLVVLLPEEQVRPLLGEDLSLAAVNGPSLCVVSGPAGAIDTLKRELTGKGLEVRLVPIAVASHSQVVEPILQPFIRYVEKVPRRAPRIPFISNVTGTWITTAEATDPAYWARHLRQTVRFAAGLHELLREPSRVLLEVGPGQTLSTLARQHPDRRAGQVVIPSMRHPHARDSDEAFLLGALGRLWLAGEPVNWSAFSAHERRQRLPLPTYPFERRRYWVEPEVREQKVGRRQEQIDDEPVAAEPASEPVASLHPRPNLLNAYVAPQGKTQRQVVTLWQELLGIDQIGIHDDFFELGGHSLLATQLVVQLREMFQVDVPLRAVLEAPTAAKLARSIEAAQRAEPAALSRSPLVAIQPSGSKRSFFCVHPVGGNVLCYADLARHLGSDQPFYGLEAPGLNGEREPCARIEDLASHYIEALRTLQLQGPYLLGGWSLGGVVAYEMAQQLRQQNEQVTLLALVDPPMPTGDTHAADDAALMVSWFARDLGGGRVQQLLISADELQRLEPDERLRYVLDRAVAAHLLLPDEGLLHIRRLFHVFEAHMRALLSYVPHAYPGQLVLFKASEPLTEGERDPTAGWSALATGGVAIHAVPGNHYTMVGEPHVRVLARRLRACLDEASLVAQRR